MIEPQDLDADPICGPTPTIDEPAEPAAVVPRWEPDNQMVAAVLASPKAWRGMTQLCDWDRAWLVAGLTLGGMTAWEIAERLGCSLRLVRSIRAEDRTQACVSAQQENRALTDDLRLERSEHGLTRRDLTEALMREAALQVKLDQILDKLVTTGKVDTFAHCGHPKVKWNVYVHKGRDRQGREYCREYCRECNRDRATKYRAHRKTPDQGRRSHNGVTVLHTESIASAV